MMHRLELDHDLLRLALSTVLLCFVQDCRYGEMQHVMIKFQPMRQKF